MIITNRYQGDFLAKVEICESDDKHSPHHYCWLELGPERTMATLMSVENLRELSYLIDQALTDHDRKPAAVIESLPMFVGDAGA